VKPTPPAVRLRFVFLDWGDTLMAERGGPDDVPMAFWPEVRAIEGAAETLALLASRYTLAIATNASVSRKDDIRRALTRVGLAGCIAHIFCYTELGRRKDEPEFWEAALNQLEAGRAEVVMVGDSLEQDVLAPRRFGIRSVWFNWKNQSAPGQPIAPVIHHLSELPALLDQLPA
jgi:FMN phosphatase YigB (HAD superfamily)